MTGRRGRLLTFAGAAAVALASHAAAQAPAPGGAMRPPAAKAPAKPPMVGNVAAAILILAIVLGASLIPSKRGHQD